jgi:hypothetical protein
MDRALPSTQTRGQEERLEARLERERQLTGADVITETLRI